VSPVLLRDALLDALALVLPVDCAGCGEPDRALCDACREALAPAVNWSSLARPGAASTASAVSVPISAPVSVPVSVPVVAGLSYDGVARRAILALKDAGRPGLARALAPALQAAAREAQVRLGAGPGVILCPIPPSRQALRRRGYAPVELLARAAGLRLTPLLKAGRTGPAQKGLGAVEREQNAEATVGLRAAVRDLEVVLLDDVVTTGATLRAAARALEAGGARVSGALVLAATPLRFGSPTPSTGSSGNGP